MFPRSLNHRVALFALCSCLLTTGPLRADPPIRPLTTRDLAGKTPSELSLMRNEIYARHGYIFERKSLDTYFRAQPWYRPTTHDFNGVIKALPPVERDNVNLLSNALKGKTSSVIVPPPPSAPAKPQPPPKPTTPPKTTRSKKQTDLDRALVDAVRGGAVAQVKTLLQQGADPNTLGPDGAGPLLLVARSGDTAIGDLLLKAGGDATAAGPNGAVPIIEAIKFGHPLMVKQLMEWGAKDATRAAFREALARGDVDSLNVLLAHGDAVHKTDLMDALSGGTFTPALMTLLLTHGADVNAQDAHGVTPLMVAASLPGADAVAFLLTHGADIKAADSDGWTALHHAAYVNLGPSERQRMCSPAAARSLVDAKANVNARDKTGATPLIRLAESIPPTDNSKTDIPDIAKILIAHGAKMNARDNNGRTALIAAAAISLPDGKLTCNPLLAKTLAAGGADVNLRDNAGNTALIRVAQADSDQARALSFARTLLLHNALPGARNDNGDTAAVLARKHGMADIAKLLESAATNKQ
ncbi:MAG: ankyrin repeat domain-containing protein [Armatimonadota bacterium]|nr:ankyrin repeat domain-containing protein [Armatimonadota bacterium]